MVRGVVVLATHFVKEVPRRRDWLDPKTQGARPHLDLAKSSALFLAK